VLARVARSALYGVAPQDPLTFVALPALVLLATIAACTWPARRAATLHPGLILKDE